MIIHNIISTSFLDDIMSFLHDVISFFMTSYQYFFTISYMFCTTFHQRFFVSHLSADCIAVGLIASAQADLVRGQYYDDDDDNGLELHWYIIIAAIGVFLSAACCGWSVYRYNCRPHVNKVCEGCVFTGVCLSTDRLRSLSGGSVRETPLYGYMRVVRILLKYILVKGPLTFREN